MDNVSTKRRATSDLNHDNWDREMEPEKKGTFQSAPVDELKNRVIRKAHRKLGGSSAPKTETDGPTKSVFSGFAGFGKTSSTETSQTTFSSGSASSGMTFGDPEKKTDANKGSGIFSFLSKFTPPVSDTKTESATEKTEKPTEVLTENNNNYNFAKSNTYYAKLKGLNQSVSSWIKTHVDKNPLCLLTPIFKDYEKYLLEIEKNEGSPPKTESSGQSSAMSTFKFSATPVPSVTFPLTTGKSDTTDSASVPKKSIFSSSSSSQKADEPPKSSTGFSFGLSANSTTSSTSTTSMGGLTPASSTGFSFSGAKPFSFGNIAPPPAAASAPAADDDEDEEPPKVEFKAVVEEDSVYSHRCKVFIKNDGNFADRGVGTLYLKPVKDSEKVQLLVRADTNLGNILVNFILNDSIPTQRMGKNNVMLVCIPNPDIKKPTPMLLRVKTSEEADELLATIDKYKKKSE